MTVALVKYPGQPGALNRALALCNGFARLQTANKVLVKPNVVFGGRIFKRFVNGVVTTTALLEELFQLLHDYGCKEITVGEASMVDKDLEVDTMNSYLTSGIKDLAGRYNVNLVDFNEGPFAEIYLADNKVKVARAALETDFFINVPVLKTHFQTRVSLGIKNLKGIINLESKKSFHRGNLDHMIALLGQQVPVDLTIIDGIYTPVNGPISLKYITSNLIIAGTDVLETDLVGTAVIGQDPGTIPYLKEYAALTGQTTDLSRVEVEGEQIKDVCFFPEWTHAFPDPVNDAIKQGGVMINHPGPSVCSGCGNVFATILARFFHENRGARYDGVEICIGKEVIPNPQSQKVFLFGNCTIRNNKQLPETIKVPIKGCCPSAKETYDILKNYLYPLSVKS